MSLRRSFAGLFTLLLMATGLVVAGPAPAHAATRYGSFDLPYGQSFLTGTIAFYDRSVHIKGTLRTTAGNCRALYASTRTADGRILFHTADNYAATCATTASRSQPFEFDLSADIRGGAAFVRMTFLGRANDGGINYADLVDCDVRPNFGCVP
uniref:hypothetical protein n=1 Tax=Paractinoplanes polyasparticus TaxID=2856853 RepID=UPI001C863DE2|nr:hypothetical protein [Actinoplanes polyasparticus]